MIKGYVRYCDRCGVELTKANNTCGFELCDKCNEALEQQLAIKNDLSVPEVTALAEWTEKLTKASEEAYNKGYADGMKELGSIMTKDKFKYGLMACGCLFKNGKTWYEHNELIKCFEDLGLLEQEPTVDLDELKRKILMEVDGGTGDRMLSYCDICDRISDSIDKYKAESEE